MILLHVDSTSSFPRGQTITPQRTQKYKIEYAHELLRIAEGDLESARALHATKAGRKENVGYLAQQYVEKCLRAVLCYKGVPVPHTQELAALFPLLDPSWSCPYGREISDLSYFATVRRYMEGSYEIENEELEASIEVASKILEWKQDIVA